MTGLQPSALQDHVTQVMVVIIRAYDSPWVVPQGLDGIEVSAHLLDSLHEGFSVVGILEG